MSKAVGALVGLGALVVGVFKYKKRKARLAEEKERADRAREIREEEDRIRKAKEAEEELKRDIIFKSIEECSNDRLVEEMNRMVDYYSSHGFYLSDKKEHITPYWSDNRRYYEYSATLTFKKKRKR